MARVRVQELGEELRSAGLLPPESEDDLAPITVVRRPGRHARSQDAGPFVGRVSEGLRERLADRLPFAAQHLTVLVAVTAAVLVVVAWIRISASSEAVPVPRAKTSAPATPLADSPSAASSGAGPVVVDVAGKVAHPGVLTLPAGSRVVDAIRKAGGARAGADLTSLNLARVLVDGEQILVGVAAPSAASSPAGTAGGGSAGAPVSLNQATLEQLESLPGVGPVTAQKILDYRNAHGAFGSIDELLDVDGIGDKTLAQLAPHLTL
ncbi:ComEA family DNA-binding protein [Nocardioides marmorisolisilvae]|uniref:ComEA family DNA-binding protein n=2 Tax=Nocardioides marmorisolisilvae TaxID=1542737 RepID=A0A3N0DXK2_9ACTN|nr:ComEA family DNA-binding protein [Nocardioides marmorisolisilvae]